VNLEQGLYIFAAILAACILGAAFFLALKDADRK